MAWTQPYKYYAMPTNNTITIKWPPTRLKATMAFNCASTRVI